MRIFVRFAIFPIFLFVWIYLAYHSTIATDEFMLNGKWKTKHADTFFRFFVLRAKTERGANKIDLTTQFLALNSHIYSYSYLFSHIHTLRRLIMSLFKFHEMLTIFDTVFCSSFVIHILRENDTLLTSTIRSPLPSHARLLSIEGLQTLSHWISLCIA